MTQKEYEDIFKSYLENIPAKGVFDEVAVMKEALRTVLSDKMDNIKDDYQYCYVCSDFICKSDLIKKEKIVENTVYLNPQYSDDVYGMAIPNELSYKTVTRKLRVVDSFCPICKNSLDSKVVEVISESEPLTHKSVI